MAFFATLVAACYTGEKSPIDSQQVGPSPLRRLSNAEYLNALTDLFPEQHPELPPLPADSVVAGFENAAEAQQPSDVRVARVETIANLYASGATSNTDAVRALAGCDFSAPEQSAACASWFVKRIGLRVFRRPLTESEHARFLQRMTFWSTSVDFEGAARLTLSTMLQSPQFLYRAEPPPEGKKAGEVIDLDPYALASRYGERTRLGRVDPLADRPARRTASPRLARPS